MHKPLHKATRLAFCGEPDQLECRLCKRLDALGPGPRAEPLHFLHLPDFDRADRIGEFWGHPETRTFGELLIDLEENRRRGRSCSGCWLSGSDLFADEREYVAAAWAMAWRKEKPWR